MKCNNWKVMLVFSVLLMFAVSGELAAQATIEMEAEYYTVYYNVESALRVVLDTGAGAQSGDTVLFSVISGDGSVAPAVDTTDGSGQVFATFTAGTNEEIVSIEAKWVNPAGTDSVMDTVDIDVKPAPTTLTITPTGRSIVTGEDLTLTAILDGVIGGDTISFTVIGEGAVIPSDTFTNASGVTTTTFAAPSSAEVDTVIGTWDDGYNDPVADTVVINVVNAPSDLTLNPGIATLALNGSQAFTARVTRSGVGVGGLMVDFTLSPGLGSVDPESGVSNGSGYVNTTYTAGTAAGIDTIIVSWTDEDLRATLSDTSIITINPGAPTSLNVTPGDTVVVVTEDATIVVELLDDYLNHVDATLPSQVTFTTDGLGSFKTASVNNGCIEVAYTTDDSMATDIITTDLVVNHTKDYDTVRTIGAAPASMVLTADDSTIVVCDGPDDTWEELHAELLDEYGNPSAYADFYAGSETDRYYWVHFSVSEGGGGFWLDSVLVDDNGETRTEEDGAYYYSSTVAGVYTITATSGDATNTIDITQIPDYPDSLFLTGDSIGIPAGSDTTLTAEAFDQYGNHVNMTSAGWVYFSTDRGLYDGGSLGSSYLDTDNGTVKIAYTCDPYHADTAHVFTVFDDLRSQYYDTVTIFSAEPGELDHFDVSLLNLPPELVFDDKALVSDISMVDSAHMNAVMIEAQDANNIRLWTYANPDTVTLTLDGSSAGASQVVWFIPDTIPPWDGDKDTIVGLTASIPEGVFTYGLAMVGIANQVAETVTMTATDTAGHSGTSPELTWLPIDVVGFSVGLEGGADTMETDVTVNVEVTAIDTFGNTTDVGLPLNIVLSANRPGIEFPGETHLMETSVDLFPTVATEVCTGLIITVSDFLNPGINGSSYPIEVIAAGVGEVPIVSNMSAKFGIGDILYSVAKAGKVEIKVYNKAGMEVGALVNGVVEPGYYQTSLKGLNLSSDIYFVVMEGPGITKRIKATLIK